MTPEEFPAYVVRLAEEAGPPTERAVTAHGWHTAAQTAIRDLARIRRVAVREMYKQGFTYTEIGVVLGVTRQRAQQLGRGRVR